LYDSYNRGASIVAKQAVKVPKAGTPAAVKAAPTTALVLSMPNAKAITADAGMTALRMIAQARANEDQIEALRNETRELVGGGGSSRGKAQVILAMAIYKAGMEDQSMRADLPKVWLDSKKHKSELNYVYKRLKMAIGVARSDGKDTDEAFAIQNKVDGDDEATLRRKASIRTNFQTMLGKATKVALHALDNSIVLSQDKNTGLLRIADGKRGDAVKKHFGESSVILNEDQNYKVLDKKGQVINVKPLKAKPSFTEVMREAGTAHGVTVEARTDSRTKAVSTNDHIIRVAGDLQKAVEKLPDEVPAAVQKALEALTNAIEQKLA
jgi:hypothetical protein